MGSLQLPSTTVRTLLLWCKPYIACSYIPLWPVSQVERLAQLGFSLIFASHRCHADWRTDTTSDLQLILGLNILLVVLGSLAKRALIDPLEGNYDSLWIDIYDVRPPQFK